MRPPSISRMEHHGDRKAERFALLGVQRLMDAIDTPVENEAVLVISLRVRIEARSQEQGVVGCLYKVVWRRHPFGTPLIRYGNLSVYRSSHCQSEGPKVQIFRCLSS